MAWGGIARWFCTICNILNRIYYCEVVPLLCAGVYKGR
jgi:hypothetical protein